MRALTATCCVSSFAQSQSAFTASESPSPGAITLSWQPHPDVSQYEIWRATDVQFSSAVPIAVNTSDTVFTDDTALCNVAYYYWLQTLATSGSVEWTGPVSAIQTTKRWDQKIGLASDRITSAPAVSSEGMIVVGSWKLATIPTDGKLTALDKDGAILWQFVPGDAGFTTPAAIATDGTVFAESLTTLYALNKSGQLLWKKPLGFRASAGHLGPALTFDNLVIFHGTNGITAVDFQGNEKWAYPARGSDVGAKYAFSPAIGSDGSIYVSTAAGGTNAVIALNSDGSLRWAGPEFCTVYKPLTLDSFESLTTFGSDSHSIQQFGPTGFLRTFASQVCQGGEVIRPNGDVLYTTAVEVRTLRTSGADESLTADALTPTPGALAIADNGAVLVGLAAPVLSPILASVANSTAKIFAWGRGYASPMTLTTNGDVLIGTSVGRVYCFKTDLRPATRGWPMQRFDQAQTGRQQAAPTLSLSTTNGRWIQITLPIAGNVQIDKSSDLSNWTPYQQLTVTDRSATLLVDGADDSMFFRATLAPLQ